MIGTRVGRYEIVAEIGRGGMGIVYRAIQTSLNRTVAVKMLPPHLALSGEYLSRFQREAETLARLAHENIVHIYDIEEKDGAHFIVMEYVAGQSLADLLRRQRRLEPARARDIASLIADALGAAHRQGIIHRDIKPDNILFSLAGQPKLTDFGIAHMRDTKFKTQTGMFMGTPLYSSPEQARGLKVTAASDLYSLGIVLYQMLCGEVPFNAEDPLAIAVKQIQEPPEPLRSKRPDLPQPLCDVVHRLLEKEPPARYASAVELREVLVSLDLGRLPGLALTTGEAGSGPSPSSCPECHTPLREEFLTCPRCGRAINRSCPRCGRLYDPISPECPFCRIPAGGAMAPPAPPEAGEETIPTPAKPSAPPAGPKLSHAADVAREGARLAGEGARVAVEGAVKVAEHLPEVSPTLVGRIWGRVRPGSGAGSGRNLLWIGGAILLLAVLLLLLRPVFSRTGGEFVASSGGDAGESVEPGDLAQSAPVPVQPPPPRGEDPTGKEGQGKTEEARPSDQVTPGGDEDVPAPEPQAFDAAGAEKEIRRIVERQRVALEAGDIQGALRDMSTEMRWDREELLRDAFLRYRDIRISIWNLEIDLEDPEQALVSFVTSFSGVRNQDGVREQMQAKEFWRLRRSTGRWLITQIWNES